MSVPQAVDDHVDGAVDGEQEVRERRGGHHPRGKGLPALVLAGQHPLHHARLVQVEEDAGQVADEEDADDAHEEERKAVLDAAAAGVALRHHGHDATGRLKDAYLM